MKKLKIYLDTSVINFLFADDAPEKRDATRKFFENHITKYEAVVSAVVLEEINRTKDISQRDKLTGKIKEYDLGEVPLEPKEEVTNLADAYVEAGVIPEKKYEDALHVALCTIHSIDVLVSWNFEHLANINKERRILAVSQKNGYFYPLRITTPLEVMDSE
jgi:predicted nucleic acid-binding protein